MHLITIHCFLSFLFYFLYVLIHASWNHLPNKQSISTYFGEKAMAPHSRTVARKIPWMEEPGRLQSMGSLRVRHDWVTSLSLSTIMHWRRKWQPTPVFLPGESHGRRSLVGCSPWGRTESDTTEATWRQHIHCWWDYQWLSASTKAWYGDWNQIISIWFHLSRDF